MSEMDPDPDEELCLIYKGLYRAVNGVIGPECIVRLRRMKFRINDAFAHCNTSLPLMNLTSGSFTEGFNFNTSDIDIMTIDKEVIVLENLSLRKFTPSDVSAVLTMDSENVSPGFTLLRCLSCDFRNERIFSSLVHKHDDFYVSSRGVRESHMSSCSTTIHGPCRSGNLFELEFDFAYTLKCPTWPKHAVPFIHRSHRNGWPDLDLLTDICTDGCLMVPINSKQQTCSELIDLEWRMSFSLAERKLVHSMNQCQFLCYGLLKIFLKEVLNKIPEICGLLCSYFMKTAVFWEITEYMGNWSQSNLIDNFFNVLRRLIKWVSIGYCPNFFIPENNMFYGKIHGRQQRDLMVMLRSLHDEGYTCLLRCASLHETLTALIEYPCIVNFMSQYECDYVPLTTIEMETVKMIYFTSGIPTEGFNAYVMMGTLYNTAALIPTSYEMTSALKLRMDFILQRIAVTLSSNQGPYSNRSRYWIVKTSQSILRKTKTFFCLNKIYLAECSYRNGDYCKSIQIAEHVRRRLHRQHYMHVKNLDRDLVLNCRQQGMTYNEIIKKYVNSGYEYKPETSIEELHLESETCEQNTGHDSFFISSLVFINFLLVLAYERLHNVHERNEVLDELHSLLYLDNGYHIFHLYKAISWEILGICQQLCGDHHGAYQSYVNALNNKYNNFKQATQRRICSLF